jgi:hypothetical protein
VRRAVQDAVRAARLLRVVDSEHGAPHGEMRSAAGLRVNARTPVGRRRPVRRAAACGVIGVVLSAWAGYGARQAWGAGSGPVLPSGGDPVALVAGQRVTLADGLVSRTWQLRTAPLGGFVTTAFDDLPHRTHWAVATGAPDFTVTIDGVALTSAQGWSSVRVATTTKAGEASVTFTATTLPAPAIPAGITVTRTYTLHAGSPTIAVASTLHNGTPLPLRIGAWTVDEITAPTAGTAEVDAYRGGSDFATSFHTASQQSGTFDVEGEVLRGDVHGAGWFIVSARRGGSMSRVGAATSAAGWRTYAGVDPARDLLDLGPVNAPNSDDNRVDNPLYPVPLRQRTVAPLGDLDLGGAWTGVYTGGTQEAAAALAAEAFGHGAPALPRSIDLNTFHPWGHGAGLSDANLRPQALLARQLGVETFMLDDQWQGKSAGDWTWDAARFPLDPATGVPRFVEYLHGLGLHLGLWMSPMEFNPGSATYAAHPDWACTPTGDASAHIQDDSGLGVWDASNPSLRAHLTSVVDHAISAWGVTEFKFDFLTWLDCPPHDYMDYEDAFVAWVHALQRSHPGVVFEIDETNDQRTWPFESLTLGTSWFDNDHTTTPVQKQLHDVWSAAPWMPPSTLGVGLYDGTLKPPYTASFLMPLALLTHVTFWTDLTTISDAGQAETAWWLAWYAQHRAELSGVVFNLTPGSDPLDGRAWAAFQPWQDGHGYVFVFHQADAAPAITLPLHGLDPETTYALTDVRTGASLGSASGASLLGGLPVVLPAAWTAQVIAVQPA